MGNDPESTETAAFERLAAFYLWALIATGIVLRIWILRSPLGVIDSDEGVTGLMARHILQGEFPVFYWGQDYGGTVEPFVTAGVFAVFGSSIAALKMVPILLHALGAVLLWRVGRRVTDEPLAKLAAATYWVLPAYFVWKSTKAHAFYGALLVFGLTTILLAQRLNEDPGSKRDLVGLGLVLGVGWWTTPQILLVAAPTVLWLALDTPRVWRGAWIVVPTAIAGAAPWIVWNATHGWTSLRLDVVMADNGYASHLRIFRDFQLPMALGLRIPFSHRWLVGETLGMFLYAAILFGLAVMVVRYRKRAEVLLAIFATFPFIYALSPWAWYTLEPRYLVLLAPLLVLLWVRLLTHPWVLGVTLSVLTALSIAGILAMNGEDRSRPPAPDVPVPIAFGPLIEALHDHDVEHAYADYWVSYRLTFESDETIITSPNTASRYGPHDDAVRADPSAATIYVVGSNEVTNFLNDHQGGLGYLSYEAGRFVVFQPQPPPP